MHFAQPQKLASSRRRGYSKHMKIGNVGPTGNASGVRKKDDKRAAAGFADLLAPDTETTESTGVSGMQPLSMMSALIAAQMMDDDAPEKRQRQHGKDLLDYLDSLRLDMLSGGISAATVQNLVREARAQVGVVLDPKLAEIISDIETRAAVELAKVEMSAKKHLQE